MFIKQAKGSFCDYYLDNAKQNFDFESALQWSCSSVVKEKNKTEQAYYEDVSNFLFRCIKSED